MINIRKESFILIPAVASFISFSISNSLISLYSPNLFDELGDIRIQNF